MALEALLLIAGVGTETAPITIASQCLLGYKYLLRYTQGTILHSFLFSLLT
jgi:hypothetical protein